MTREKHPDVEASFDYTDLEALTARVRQVLDIRDRKYGFPSKTYPQCFVGREAVAQLVKEGIASDEEDAVRGQAWPHASKGPGPSQQQDATMALKDGGTECIVRVLAQYKLSA